MARILLYRGSGAITISALFAASACMVTPPAVNAVSAAPADDDVVAMDGAAAGAAPVALRDDVLSDDAIGNTRVVPPPLSPPLPVNTARNVCATRTASAFLR